MSDPIKQVRKIFQDIRKETSKARSAALNKSARSALSHTLKEFRQNYNVKLKDLKNITSITKARKGEHIVTIRFLDKSLGLEYFRPSKRNKGIAATVRKGNRKLYKSSFYGKINASHITIFKREGKSRMPIERLYGANPAKIMTTDESLEKMAADFFKIFDKNFDRALAHFLK